MQCHTTNISLFSITSETLVTEWILRSAVVWPHPSQNTLKLSELLLCCLLLFIRSFGVQKWSLSGAPSNVHAAPDDQGSRSLLQQAHCWIMTVLQIHHHRGKLDYMFKSSLSLVVNESNWRELQIWLVCWNWDWFQIIREYFSPWTAWAHCGTITRSRAWTNKKNVSEFIYVMLLD